MSKMSLVRHADGGRHLGLHLGASLLTCALSLALIAPSAAQTSTCATAWNASSVYTHGDTSSENGVNYQANWWTQGNDPATHSGGAGSGQPWTALGSCSSGQPTPPAPPAPPSPPSPPAPPAPPVPPGTVTSGIVHYHLLLGVGQAQDELTLDGGNYNDLIMSNLIAGVMEGHLIEEYSPGIKYNRDELYGSVLGQLLQENIETGLYEKSTDKIDPSPLQAPVMSVGQGGPYQINNYTADMIHGSYTPAGGSLINFVALQKNIGYSMAGAPTQVTKPTPASFNNKYYSPMLTAYFHYLDFVALNKVGKGPQGWQTPWQPEYDQMLVTFKTLPKNFLDVILNVAYNQGYYGGLVARYSTLGATATAATVSQVDDFASVWGKTSTYEQYPYQVRYYLGQLYDTPVPTAAAALTLHTPNNHVIFHMTTLRTVFAKVFHKLAYVNTAGQYGFIPAASADAAFDAALAEDNIAANATLDLSNTGDRAHIFDLLEDAISGLETSLGTSFNATTTTQL